MDMDKWLGEVSASIDAKDSDKFASFITEDGQFRFGSTAPVHGRQNIRDYVAAFFTMIKSSRHKVVNAWKEDGVIIWQGEVLYTRLNGTEITIPFVNIFNMDGDLIKDYLIYIDNGPLFAEGV
jgi:ketosteroid isomerase-like protein